MVQRVAAAANPSWPGATWKRLLHNVGQGLSTSGAAAAAHEHLEVAGALLARQNRPRRIAVLGATGGVGTTTVSVLLASVLSAARGDPTLLLTAHSDASDAASRLMLPHAPSITAVIAELRRHGQIPPTPVTTTGVRVLAAPLPGAPRPEPGLAALLDAAAAGHPCAVVDAGVAGQIADLSALAELVDTVVLVCASTPDAVHATDRVLARWIDQTTPDTTAVRLLLVPVQRRTRTGLRAVDPQPQLPAHAGKPHAMPHERELARGAAIKLSTLSGPALTAVLGLAADIMGHR